MNVCVCAYVYIYAEVWLWAISYTFIVRLLSSVFIVQNSVHKTAFGKQRKRLSQCSLQHAHRHFYFLFNDFECACFYIIRSAVAFVCCHQFSRYLYGCWASVFSNSKQEKEHTLCCEVNRRMNHSHIFFYEMD